MTQEFKDHIVQYPNRFKRVPVAGKTDEFDMIPTWMENPSEVVQVGTPIDRQLFEGFSAQLADMATDVKRFGATGGGVSNDSVQVQNAINNKSGQKVILPPGTYILDNLTVPSDTQIVGVGKVIIKPVSGYANIFNVTGNNVVFENLVFELPVFTGLAGGANTHCIYGVNNSNILLSRCIFNDGGGGFFFDNVTNLKVINCEGHRSNQWHFNVGACDGLLYARNRVFDAKQYDGLKVSGSNVGAPMRTTKNILVAFNECARNARDGFDIATNNGENITIVHNNFHDNTFQGVDFKVIQQSDKGIANGIISDNLLVGNGMQGVNIQSDVVGFPIKDVTVENNLIKSVRTPNAIGIRVDHGDNITIKDNRVKSVRTGVRAIRLKNSRILNNEMKDDIGIGVIVEVQTSGETYTNENNTIEGNEIVASEAQAIQVGLNGFTVGTNNLITKNKLKPASGQYSIFAQAGSVLYFDNVVGMQSTVPSGRGTIGDVVLNTVPTAGGYEKWVAVTTSSDASWKGVGLIQA